MDGSRNVEMYLDLSHALILSFLISSGCQIFVVFLLVAVIIYVEETDSQFGHICLCCYISHE